MLPNTRCSIGSQLRGPVLCHKGNTLTHRVWQHISWANATFETTTMTPAPPRPPRGAAFQPHSSMPAARAARTPSSAVDASQALCRCALPCQRAPQRACVLVHCQRATCEHVLAAVEPARRCTERPQVAAGTTPHAQRSQRLARARTSSDAAAGRQVRAAHHRLGSSRASPALHQHQHRALQQTQQQRQVSCTSGVQGHGTSSSRQQAWQRAAGAAAEQQQQCDATMENRSTAGARALHEAASGLTSLTGIWVVAPAGSFTDQTSNSSKGGR
jgi:hypothetical protein